MDLENFDTASRRCTGVSNDLFDGQLVDYTTTVERVVVECTLVDCNPLTPLLPFVRDLSQSCPWVHFV